MSDQDNLQDFAAATSASQRACALADAGKIDEAMVLFARVIALCPVESYLGNPRIMRGAVLMDQNRAAEALADFDFAVAEGCSYPHEAYRRRGNALTALGRGETALADFRRALEEGEGTAHGYERIVAMPIALGCDGEALAEPFEDLDGAEDAQRRLLLAHAELRLLRGDAKTAAACVDKADGIGGDDDSEPALARAVIRCVPHYLAGGWREAEGNAAAQAHYRSAAAETDARWTVEFALARRRIAQADKGATRPASARRSKILASPLRLVAKAAVPVEVPGPGEVGDFSPETFKGRFAESTDLAHADRNAAVNAAAADDDSDQQRHRLTIAHCYLGAIAFAQGDRAAARGAFETAVQSGLPYLVQFGMARQGLAELG